MVPTPNGYEVLQFPAPSVVPGYSVPMPGKNSAYKENGGDVDYKTPEQQSPAGPKSGFPYSPYTPAGTQTEYENDFSFTTSSGYDYNNPLNMPGGNNVPSPQSPFSPGNESPSESPYIPYNEIPPAYEMPGQSYETPVPAYPESPSAEVPAVECEVCKEKEVVEEECEEEEIIVEDCEEEVIDEDCEEGEIIEEDCEEETPVPCSGPECELYPTPTAVIEGNPPGETWPSGSYPTPGSEYPSEQSPMTTLPPYGVYGTGAPAAPGGYDLPYGDSPIISSASIATISFSMGLAGLFVALI